jgi:hypothetical protein
MEHEKPEFKLWSHFKPKLKLQSLFYFFGCKHFRATFNAKNKLMELEKPEFKLESHLKLELELGGFFFIACTSKLLSALKVA